MSGMLMSNRIRSGGSRRAADSANWPPGTGRTLYPRSLSMPASTWRLAGVSSTTRMPAGDPARRSGGGRFTSVPPAEQVQQLLVLKGLGQAAQPAGGAGVAGLPLLDPGQETVQVRGDDRVPHRADEVGRPARQGLGREVGPVLRVRGSGGLGVDVFNPDV